MIPRPTPVTNICNGSSWPILPSSLPTPSSTQQALNKCLTPPADTHYRHPWLSLRLGEPSPTRHAEEAHVAVEEAEAYEGEETGSFES